MGRSAPSYQRADTSGWHCLSRGGKSHCSGADTRIVGWGWEKTFYEVSEDDSGGASAQCGSADALPCGMANLPPLSPRHNYTMRPANSIMKLSVQAHAAYTFLESALNMHFTWRVRRLEITLPENKLSVIFYNLTVHILFCALENPSSSSRTLCLWWHLHTYNIEGVPQNLAFLRQIFDKIFGRMYNLNH